jgi:hypothetical protein
MHERLTRETDILSGGTRTFSIVPVQLIVCMESRVRKGLTEAARFPWNATGGQAILHTSIKLAQTKKNCNYNEFSLRCFNENNLLR